jgi:hypothetical protein
MAVGFEGRHVGKRLYTEAIVHYRDETDIPGFVAPDDPRIIS